MNIQEINLKGNELLEKTKNTNQYEVERKALFDMLEHLSENNCIEVEQYISKFDNIVKIDEKMQIKGKEFEYLRRIAECVKEQKIRKDDNEKINKLFEIQIDNKKYQFITRQYAEEYARNNDKNKNIEIKIVDNNNIELKELLEIIEKNFSK